MDSKRALSIRVELSKYFSKLMILNFVSQELLRVCEIAGIDRIKIK